VSVTFTSRSKTATYSTPGPEVASNRAPGGGSGVGVPGPLSQFLNTIRLEVSVVGSRLHWSRASSVKCSPAGRVSRRGTSWGLSFTRRVPEPKLVVTVITFRSPVSSANQ